MRPPACRRVHRLIQVSPTQRPDTTKNIGYLPAPLCDIDTCAIWPRGGCGRFIIETKGTFTCRCQRCVGISFFVVFLSLPFQQVLLKERMTYFFRETKENTDAKSTVGKILSFFFHKRGMVMKRLTYCYRWNWKSSSFKIGSIKIVQNIPLCARK